MPSPFPGMDPFLEDDKIWPTFHHHFIAGLFQILLPNLIDRYRARVGQRQYATEMPLFTSIIREEHCEEFIEVRQRSDNKLVTLVDVVSPANKLTIQGKNAYLDRRRDARIQHASIVEIDLVLQGQPLLDYSREGLPDWDYAVTVTRAMQPERHEIYTATVQKRLPRFKLPLALDDRDTVIDLQAAFARCYDQGGFSAQIDYQSTPALIANQDDRTWVNDLLVQMKVRSK
jgi:Protein of unknown function (DUF4058)